VDSKLLKSMIYAEKLFVQTQHLKAR